MRADTPRNYINRKENRDIEHKKISYEITIVESDRSHIEHIILKGNTKTKDKVILREFSLEPGDIFSKGKLMSSVRTLYNLRYFSTIAPDLVQGSEENLVDVVLAVEEQSTASVQFGVYFCRSYGCKYLPPFRVFVTWEDSNFRGYGQTLSTNLTASPDTQNASVGFSENWFLGSPLTVSFNLSVSHQQLYAYQDILFPVFNDVFYNANGVVPDPYTSLAEYEASSTVDSSYRMKYDHWTYGAGVSTGYRWNPNLATIALRGGLNFSVVQNFYDANLYRPADKEIRDQYGMWKWNNSFWTRLSLDRRDLGYDPSTGWFASQQITWYGLFPNIETSYYTRFETKAEGYLTLCNIPIMNAWNLKFVLSRIFGIDFPSSPSEVKSDQRYQQALYRWYVQWTWMDKPVFSLFSSGQRPSFPLGRIAHAYSTRYYFGRFFL